MVPESPLELSSHEVADRRSSHAGAAGGAGRGRGAALPATREERDKAINEQVRVRGLAVHGGWEGA